MKNFFNQLLLIKVVRIFVGKIRFYWFARIRGKVVTLESKDAINHTVKHNLKSLAMFGGSRMEKLIKPVSVLENISKDSRILVIGPRNEDDILNLIANGFDSRNIRGLDLISYSPFIEVGDMHKTRFEDSFFDLIICGWTLSYSNQPQKFAHELLRIIKSDGIIGIAVEYSTMTDEQSIASHGGYALKMDSQDRINSTSQILALFQPKVKHIFFDHDAPNKISHGDKLVANPSSVVAIFSVAKDR
jgi:hypothetical protein